jgi:hypothetical protein
MKIDGVDIKQDAEVGFLPRVVFMRGKNVPANWSFPFMFVRLMLFG